MNLNSWLSLVLNTIVRPSTSAPPSSPALLQENGFYILQENGSKILLS